ncbi:PREDICTED: protein GLE1 [Camelina sativa]|uniref:mRNA export factor GLE1 n=1 Tax=Camelina sativa TaxID=90675 RepID=A0ABM0WUD7_CAMSA|nr:PREDICTED: protein GLE1 [Camelina sativa]XP_010476302.1 PREDICTED: protein GLE1 [Camelina sativa]
MGIVLEPRCPRNVDGISIDPEPNWNFHSLVSAIESVEKKLNAFSKFPQPITNSTSRMGRSGGGFVMHVSEDEMESDDEDEESEEEEEEEEDKDYSQICTVGRRFTCDEYLSDESDDEFDHEPEYMMNKMGLAESALYDVNNNHQTEIKDDIRNQVTVVETEIMNEIETSRSAIARVEKYSETRKEVERKLDLQYQRKVAEALDTHLTAIQREHKIKSQIEERKIRSEEEARRRERAHQEERTRQEKARVEAEMLAKSRAEEAKKEVERKAAKEVAEKEEADRKAAEQKLAEEKAVTERISVAGSSATSNAQAGGKSIQAAESALTLEKHRLKKLEELGAMNQSLKSSSNQDFSSFERHIARVIKQISGVKDNVSAKINEIVKIFKDPSCPVSISIATFAKKMVSGRNPNPFACSYVIVYVTSQFPQAMDIILAEFHKACIYTVPKHIVNSQTAWDSEAYERLSSIMRLYGALVQTDIRGGNATNIHGIEHGWAWLARFLNKISANNRVTATALNAFLQTAGFGLHQRYKSQFVKVVNVVREHFLQRLRAKKDTKDLQPIIADIMAYLDDKMYLKEPEGRTMQASLLSTEYTAELDRPQNNNQYYQRNNYRDNYY